MAKKPPQVKSANKRATRRRLFDARIARKARERQENLLAARLRYKQYVQELEGDRAAYDSLSPERKAQVDAWFRKYEGPRTAFEWF